jgi:hypothetical protein
MTSDIPFVPLVGLGTLVFTLVNFLKFLSGRDWNAAITQGVAWVSGIISVVLVAHTDFGNSITIAGHYLDNLNWSSQLFLGLMAASLLSTANEFKKAFDHTDSASTPPLIPRKSKVLGIATESTPGVRPQSTIAHSHIPHDSSMDKPWPQEPPSSVGTS